MDWQEFLCLYFSGSCGLRPLHISTGRLTGLVWLPIHRCTTKIFLVKIKMCLWGL